MSKGQIVTIDLFLAIFVFIILLLTIVFIWRDYTLRLDRKVEFNHMQLKAFQISDTLIKNPGTPTAWENNPDETEVIGLAHKDRVLSPEKIAVFTNTEDLGYDDIKRLFMIDRYDYDFYFQLKELDGDEIEDTEVGVAPTGNYIVKLQRRVLYNNEETIMEFALWN